MMRVFFCLLMLMFTASCASIPGWGLPDWNPLPDGDTPVPVDPVPEPPPPSPEPTPEPEPEEEEEAFDGIRVEKYHVAVDGYIHPWSRLAVRATANGKDLVHELTDPGSGTSIWKGQPRGKVLKWFDAEGERLFVYGEGASVDYGSEVTGTAKEMPSVQIPQRSVLHDQRPAVQGEDR